MSTRARPLGRLSVSVPEELLDRSTPKATGVVRLSDHIAWSPPYEYDLTDRQDRRDAYQRVTTEGLADDGPSPSVAREGAWEEC